MKAPLGLTLAQRNLLFDLVKENDGLMAAHDSPRDRQLQALTELGALTHYDSMFGNRYYSLTKEGEAEIRPRSTPQEETPRVPDRAPGDTPLRWRRHHPNLPVVTPQEERR